MEIRRPPAVTGRSELPDMGADNQTWVLWKLASTFNHWVTSSPHFGFFIVSGPSLKKWKTQSPTMVTEVTSQEHEIKGDYIHTPTPDIPLLQKEKQHRTQPLFLVKIGVELQSLCVLLGARTQCNTKFISLGGQSPTSQGEVEERIKFGWFSMVLSSLLSVKPSLLTFIPKLIPIPVLKELSCLWGSWQL